MEMLQEASNQLEENKDLVRRFIEGFWNENRTELAATMLSTDYKDHAYTPGTKDGLIGMSRVLLAAFPDQQSSIQSIVGDGDRVVARLVLRGTHQGTFRGVEPTGLSVEVNLYREYRLEQGLIAEHWALFDTAALLSQIGGTLNQQTVCQIKRG
ncbi:ester cyclase [Paenibacillus hexagrammi]|uniref:Ester cyclase n=1 Tax=Paenibacillus hexagrammi TaxID=2908839 RepID=A0ABY3SLP6_9BACL|nr:ester cyclase [Paenibacillus sp. YPD9-1]UJF34045.1 ester cyclase [Paenibacillus sp. YPD9-1]